MSHRFIAIDFETANYQSDSACSVGLVVVEGQKIISKHYYLIRPPYRDFVFTYVHGLTWRDVAKAPTFEELWPTVEPMFENIDFIAAHNASFDRRVLNACCERYGISPPEIPYTCTLQMAKKQLLIKPSGLASVCKTLNIQLEHHNAISDALACAQIVIHANSLARAVTQVQPTKNSQSKNI